MSWSHRKIQKTAGTVRQENLPLNFAFDRAMGAVRVSPKQGVIGPGVARRRHKWMGAEHVPWWLCGKRHVFFFFQFQVFQ